MNWSSEEQAKLFQSRSARNFLQQTFVLKTKLSYAKLGRLCGFESRSYLRDIVIGKKAINLKLASQISLALGLSTDCSEFFLKLCSLDYPGCRLAGFSEFETKRALKKYQKSSLSVDYSSGFMDYNIPQVFASLGSVKNGATLDQIVKRTSMPKDAVLLTLEKMYTLTLLTRDLKKFYPIADHAISSEMNSKSFFKDYYLKSLEKKYESVKKNMNSSEHLFFASDFLLSKEKLRHLKKLLKKTLINFIEDNDITEGDKVVNITCAFG